MMFHVPPGHAGVESAITDNKAMLYLYSLGAIVARTCVPFLPCVGNESKVR